MGKLKLTKTELKKQKELLQRFIRFLPTLQLKKQQLQFEIRKLEKNFRQAQNDLDMINKEMEPWIAVFAEEVKIEEKISIEKVVAIIIELFM